MIIELLNGMYNHVYKLLLNWLIFLLFCQAQPKLSYQSDTPLDLLFTSFSDIQNIQILLNRKTKLPSPSMAPILYCKCSNCICTATVLLKQERQEDKNATEDEEGHVGTEAHQFGRGHGKEKI